jgi:solute carrier family 7 (L-type amino acid transporter), member 9/15
MSSPRDEDSRERQPLLQDGLTQEQASGDTAPTADVEARGTFSRNLGAREAFAIVISIVIGSGIFTSPGSIDTNVPSPGVALVIWLVGGVLAWTGASTLAELGTAIPGEGMIGDWCLAAAPLSKTPLAAY